MSDGPKDEIERAITERFKGEVCLKSGEVDPEEELDWFALSLGFFLAAGLNIDDAHRLSIWARYDAQYWQ